MKTVRLRTLALALGAALALVGSLALGQQPPGQPGQQPPFPAGHPPVPGIGQPGRPPGRQPGGRPPMILGPDGRPQGLPPPGSQPGGRQRPGRPGFPPSPGTAPPSRQRPQHPPVAHEAEEEHGEHECPGHGANDEPPPVNYWHGLLMVNNERALQPGVVNQLLFRYENPKNPCDPRNEPPPYLASLINFAVLAFVLFRFGRKPLTEGLLKRKQTIMADIDTATKLREDAEARLEDYEERLENIEQKRSEVRAEFAAQAEVETTHVLAEAEERRGRMRRDAEFRIEQERKTAREELLHEAVVAATAAAQALILEQMSRADHDRMAADYLASIGPAFSVSSSPTHPTSKPAGGIRA